MGRKSETPERNQRCGMDVFTVTKPGGTKDFEFQAYTRLLEEIGVDVANVPRIPEPGTHNRWLYTWRRKEEAEGFARELRLRTRDASWRIHEFSVEEEMHGPVAPLDIYEVHDEDHVFKYYLAPASRERVIRAFPHTALYPFRISQQNLDLMKRQFGESWWDQLSVSITGISKEKILSLGGYRIILPGGEIGHEELPEVPATR
jgi:hypothetical protein